MLFESQSIGAARVVIETPGKFPITAGAVKTERPPVDNADFETDRCTVADKCGVLSRLEKLQSDSAAFACRHSSNRIKSRDR